MKHSALNCEVTNTYKFLFEKSEAWPRCKHKWLSQLKSICSAAEWSQMEILKMLMNIYFE